MTTLLDQLENSKDFVGNSRGTLLDQLREKKSNSNIQILTNLLSAGKNPFGIPDFGPEASKVALDVGGRLAYGAPSWLSGNLGKFLTIGGQKLGDLFGTSPDAESFYPAELNERTKGLTDSKAQLERGRFVEEQIGSAFGLIPPPKESTAEIMEEVMKPIEAVTTPLRKVADWLIPDKYVNLQEFANFISELTTFKILHGLSSSGVKQLEKSFNSIDLKVKEGNLTGAEAEAKEILKNDDNKNLLDEILHDAGPTVKNLQESRELPKPKEGDASPIPQYQAGERTRAAKAAEETNRTNREAKEDFQRKQQLKEMLDKKVDEIRAKKEAKRLEESKIKEAPPVKEGLTSKGKPLGEALIEEMGSAEKTAFRDPAAEFRGIRPSEEEAQRIIDKYADEVMRHKRGEKLQSEESVEFTGPTFNDKTDPDLVQNYSIYGRKAFDDPAEAKKYLETNEKVQAERADLASTGHDLEIIKVGNKYRLAENLAATDVELGLMDSIIESRDIPVYTMKETGNLVRDLQNKYEAGELDVYELQEGVLELSRSAQRSGDPDINGAMEKVLDVVNKEVRKFEIAQEEAITPKEVESGVFMAEHPTTRETVIYSPEGKPFTDALSAYDYMESMGIVGKGVVETVRRRITDPITGRLVTEEGFVVNPNKQPQPIKFTEKYLYHSTSKENLINIKVEGLKTSNERTAISFAVSEDIAEGFNKGEILLRVKETDGSFEEAAYPTTRRTFENIPPERLQIKVGDKWEPLTSKVEYRSKILTELAEADRLDEAFLEANKTQWERIAEILSKPLRNESGQITLTEGQTESLRKMINQVLKSGKNIKEYFSELGYNSEQLAILEEAVKAVGLKTLEENKNNYVNIGKMERKGKEGVVITRPMISRKIADDLIAAKDFKYKTAAGEFLAEHTTTVFKAEDSGSQYVMNLQPRIWEAEAMKRDALKAEVQKLKAVSKGISNQSFDRIYTRALWNQERFQARMISNELPKRREGKLSKEEYKKLFEAKRAELEKEMPVLTPEEMKVYKHMRSVLDDIGEDLFRVMSETNKDPITRQKNYFTIAYAEGLESLKQNHNTIYDPEGSINYRGPLYEEKLFGSLKKRSKKGLPFALEKSAKKVFLNYLNNALDYIHKQPLISELNEVLSDKGWDLGKRHLTASSKEKIDPYFLSKEKPGLYKFIRRLNNQLTGRDPEAWGSWGPREEKIIRKITSNIVGAVIGFLPRTGVVQISSLKNTAAITGRHTFTGIYDSLNIGKFKAARRESPFLKVSISDAELDAIFQGGVMGRTKRAATIHIKYIDAWTRTVSYLAAKRYIESNNAKIRAGRLKGKIYEGKDLIWEAERITAKTQASGLATDIAPIQRSAVGKALYLLQTFTINEWNLLYKEVLGIGKEGMSYRRRGMRLFNYALATAAINTLLEDVFQINSSSPSPIKTIMRLVEEGEDPATITKEVALDILGAVPGLFGSLRYGSSIFGLAVDTLDSFVEAIADDNWSKATQLGGTLAGVRGTRQMYNMYKQYEQGEENPYRYIMGQPPDTPYRKKKRPSL